MCSHQNGITLLEMLLGLSILLVMLALAAAVWQPLQQTLQCRLMAYQLLHSLHLARSTALLQQLPVTLCGSSDGLHCDAAWQSAVLMRSEKQIIVRKWTNVTTQVHFSAFTGDKYITFLRNGQTLQNGQFVVATSRGDQKYKLILSLTGRSRMEGVRQAA